MIRAIMICMVLAVGHSMAGEAMGPTTNLENGRYHERYTGDLKKAKQFYTAALNHKDASSELKLRAKLGLATCAILEGKQDKALQLMTEALKDRPVELKRLLVRRQIDAVGPQKRQIPPIEESEAKMILIRKKLEAIVIPKVSFVDAQVSKVFKYLEKQSKTHDKDGEGLRIILKLVGVEDAPPKGDTAEPETPEDELPEPTVTVDFEKIPLGQVLRFLCEQANLRLKVEEDGVHVLNPATGEQGLQLRFFPIDPDRFLEAYRKRMPKTADDGENGGLDFKGFFEKMGVDFPKDRFGGKASLSYDRTTNQLVVRNFTEQLRLMEKILDRMNMPQPQVLINAQLVEVKVENAVLSRIKTGDLPAFIDGLPSNRRTVLGEFSTSAMSGTKARTGERGANHIFGKAAHIIHNLNSSVKVHPNLYNISLDVDWGFAAWTPAFAPVVDRKSAKGAPFWSASVNKKISLWDGQAMAIKLSHVKPKLKCGPVFLVLRTTIVDPAGNAIRKEKEPNAGWLKVDGSLYNQPKSE